MGMTEHMEIDGEIARELRPLQDAGVNVVTVHAHGDGSAEAHGCLDGAMVRQRLSCTVRSPGWAAAELAPLRRAAGRGAATLRAVEGRVEVEGPHGRTSLPQSEWCQVLPLTAAEEGQAELGPLRAVLDTLRRHSETMEQPQFQAAFRHIHVHPQGFAEISDGMVIQRLPHGLRGLARPLLLPFAAARALLRLLPDEGTLSVRRGDGAVELEAAGRVLCVPTPDEIEFPDATRLLAPQDGEVTAHTGTAVALLDALEPLLPFADGGRHCRVNFTPVGGRLRLDVPGNGCAVTVDTALPWTGGAVSVNLRALTWALRFLPGEALTLGHDPRQVLRVRGAAGAVTLLAGLRVQTCR